MKNLRNLLNQDSDSFNEKLKIAVCSVLGLKIIVGFALAAILFGCDPIKERENKIDQEIYVLGDDKYSLMTTTWCYTCSGNSLILLTIVYSGYPEDYFDGGSIYYTRVLNDSVKIAQRKLAEKHLARTLDIMKLPN